MVFTDDDLQEKLHDLFQHGKKSLHTLDLHFEEELNWLKSVRNGLKNGTITGQSILVPKTPAKRKKTLNVINESLETPVDSGNVRRTRSSTQNQRASRRLQGKKAGRNIKKEVIVEDDEEVVELDLVDSLPIKRQKREDTVSATSKRVGKASETTSRDSGLSSVGSDHTRGAGSGDIVVKQEPITPRNSDVENQTSTGQDEGESNNDQSERNSNTFVSALSSGRSPLVGEPPRKRSRSSEKGDATFVFEKVPRKGSRSHSEPRESNAPQASLQEETFTISHINNYVPPPNSASLAKSPVIFSSPPTRLLKGETVKKAVRAFEALNEDHDSECGSTTTASTFLVPPSKKAVTSKVVAPASTTSLDDAVNAPTRLTRTKTRAMAKAAAKEETKAQKDDQTDMTGEKATQKDNLTAASVSEVLKSPVQQLKSPLKQLQPSQKNLSLYEKQNATFTASKLGLKSFGSATKQPQLLLKASTPLNRFTALTPNHSASSSFSAPKLNNLITNVDSFILKPVTINEIKPSREENLQKLVARAEVASKKKEEMMKAQLEERIKKRQEKTLKVNAAREAMEKEKQEMLQKAEREREERLKQLHAEREEKLRQEALKKKRLALQKAAETEERRRQEEAARLAKLKQQEEEQKRLAAQRKKEQEEAERKHLERLRLEREAQSAREAERLAKEAALKAKLNSKALLDQTYTKESPPPQSYGMTPDREDRQPLPSKKCDDYGIDDAASGDSSEDEDRPKKRVPEWALYENRMPKLLDDYEIKDYQVSLLFGSQKSTPDLSKIFTTIDRRQLIRKSSAVWRTPPVK